MGLICEGKGKITAVQDALKRAQKTHPTCPKLGWQHQLEYLCCEY